MLKTIFCIFVNSKTRGQRNVVITKAEVPFKLRLYALRIIAAIVGALGDRIIGARVAFEVAERNVMRCRVMQHVADADAIDRLQLVPVAFEVITVRCDLATPVITRVDNIAELILRVFAVENVARGCRVTPVRIDCIIVFGQAEIGLV